MHLRHHKTLAAAADGIYKISHVVWSPDGCACVLTGGEVRVCGDAARAAATTKACTFVHTTMV